MNLENISGLLQSEIPFYFAADGLKSKCFDRFESVLWIKPFVIILGERRPNFRQGVVSYILAKGRI